MNQPKPRFVIWGYGSENVLINFGEMLATQGYDVLFLPDKNLNSRQELETLLRAPYVLLTSAHFGRDTRILRDFYPEVHIENEFLDLLHHCPPALSVFYPHDLSTPLVINEPLLLDAFDLVLWPTPFFGYQPRPKKLFEVGWIGFRDIRRPMANRQYDSVLLFSDICHHKQHFGIAKTHAKLLPVLETGTAIKFPNWPGHEAFEDHFARHGANIVPAVTPAGSVIQDSRLIVSNSISSISIEAAYMGTPAINLLETYLPDGIQKSFLAGLRGCVLSSYAEFHTNFAAPPEAPQPCIKRFDAALALELILTELEYHKHRRHAPYSSIELAPHAKATGHSNTHLSCVPKSSVVSTEVETSEPIAAVTASHEAQPEPALPGTQADEIELATAMRLLDLDQVEAAFDILQAMVTTGTSLAAPYRQIALLALKQNETQVAEEFLTLACERESPPGEAHLDLANLFFSTQRFKDTLKVLSPLLRSNPIQSPDAYALLRRALGELPALDAISWARLLTDIRWQTR